MEKMKPEESVTLLRIFKNKNSSKRNGNISSSHIFQTREFEERFLKVGIPYRIIGGIKFYERAEIRLYMLFKNNKSKPMDDLSFERIINVPRDLLEYNYKTISEFSKKTIYH